MSNHKHPEQTYNTCRGIIFLSRNYGQTRLNKACRKAIYLGYYSYKAVQDILKNNNENIEIELDLFPDKLPDHQNIRGNNYFKDILKEIVQ